MTRSGNTLLLKGMNVQLESGLESSTGTPNGLGNLIIGYDECPGTQTGSGNLVLGTGQSFTSYGGILAGNDNTIRAPFASVTGGQNNTASGESSTITGGQLNVASDPFALVAGGCANLAGTGTQPTGTCSSSTGGEAVLGGTDDQASDQFAGDRRRLRRARRQWLAACGQHGV